MMAGKKSPMFPAGVKCLVFVCWVFRSKFPTEPLEIDGYALDIVWIFAFEHFGNMLVICWNILKCVGKHVILFGKLLKVRICCNVITTKTKQHVFHKIQELNKAIEKTKILEQ